VDCGRRDGEEGVGLGTAAARSSSPATTALSLGGVLLSSPQSRARAAGADSCSRVVERAAAAFPSRPDTGCTKPYSDCS
jgi:hypothetical protein